MVHAQKHNISDSALLNTKLYKPDWRSGLVSRPKLLKKLDAITQRRLTIISAPAGFGKTTLLTEWIHNTPVNTCWVSLSETDNDPIVFWSYVIAAIQRSVPEIGEPALSLLLTPQSQPLHVITALLNTLSTLKDHLVLLLDDYHLIESESIHKEIDFFLNHLPPYVHIVLSTRTIPPLPLARLRAKKELLEINAAFLRFSSEEATIFLNESMSLKLTPDYVDVLANKTEGWIAGLQLAALSLNGRSDRDSFIQEFSGDDRYILDYLAEEVLQQHPEIFRRFLLHTSTLTKFNASLCNAVTLQSNSAQILAQLERANLFLVPLDNKRNWYRYHHLFGDVLLSKLKLADPSIESELHLRASLWHEKNDSPMDAIYHSLKGKHFDKAVALIEKTALYLFEHGQSLTLYNLLDQLPQNFDSASPILSTWFVWKNIDEGKLELAEKYLVKAEKGIQSLPFEQHDAQSESNAQYRVLPGTLLTARALVSQAYGRIPDAIDYAKEAIKNLPEQDTLWKGGAISILGLASWSTGDLDTAYNSFYNGLHTIQTGGTSHYRIAGTHVLAEIRIEQGRLRDAKQLFLDALKIASEWNGSTIRGTADLYIGMADLAVEHNDIENAESYISKAHSLGKDALLRENKFRQFLVHARIQEAKGKLDEALNLLHVAEDHYIRDAVPNTRPIDALRIRLLIALDKLPEAESWAKQKGLSTSNSLTYLSELDCISLVRILIAQYEVTRSNLILNEAIQCLKKLEQQAESASRNLNLITIYLLQAICYERQSQLPNALNFVNKALALGEPEQFFRTFLEENQVIHNLLRHAVATNMGGYYARKLLSAYERQVSLEPHYIATQFLQHPLTKRELEILRLIAGGMRNQEIADHLYISLSTVKRHIANTYNKLEVNHRTEAINKATELGLL